MRYRLAVLITAIGAILLAGCGMNTNVQRGSQENRVSVALAVSPGRSEISVPPWRFGPDVSVRYLGFGKGYISQFAQNAVIWSQKGWRFQVVGPIVVVDPTEAQDLYASFSSVSSLKGEGVIQLRETRHLWLATMTWSSGHRVYKASFRLVGPNTGLVLAVYRFVLSRHLAPTKTIYRCRTHLFLIGQQIRDKLACVVPPLM